jgi:hypothetical protein
MIKNKRITGEKKIEAIKRQIMATKNTHYYNTEYDKTEILIFYKIKTMKT